MNAILAQVDPLMLVPRFAVIDALCFAVYVLVVVLLPGNCLRRLSGLTAGSSIERWSLGLILGIVWASFAYLMMTAAGRPEWHIYLACAPLAARAALMLAAKSRWRHLLGWRPLRNLGRVTMACWLGLVILGGFVVHHTARVASLVEYREDGLRLYGAMFSDKLTVMSTCAALVHDVPPRCLRMAGYSFPSHYFPHLFVAASTRGTGVDFVNGYWFYAAALGMAANGLSILAFCRRWFGSYRLGGIAIVLYGLFCFGVGAKTLDLSFALLLEGLLAVERLTHSGRRRWFVLTAILWGVMPCYEVFHAITLYGGLIAWCAAAQIRALWPRRAAIRPPTREVRLRALLSGLTLAVAWCSVRVLYQGERVIAPPTVELTNTYRQSFKDDWRDWMRGTPEGSFSKTIYSWQRGKPNEPSGRRPRPLERIAGELIYTIAFLGYLVKRFLGAGIFGALAVAAWRRHSTNARRGSARTKSLVVCVVLCGYAIPWFVNWGYFADSQWWWTPNIYRLPNFSFRLLLVIGVAELVRATHQFVRPKYALPLALFALSVWPQARGLWSPARQFLRVEPDTLAALAFIRNHVPFGEIVMHPWQHDLIRDRARPDEVNWVYKRHFTLGSSLAGAQMYYEGREDHLFINGFVTPEEVFRRSRTRRLFYEKPSAPVVDQVLGAGDVGWVVADRENPAPESIRAGWRVAFKKGGVRIYARPSS